MTELSLAITLFFISHLIPAAPALRGGLVRVLGKRGYFAFFGSLSVGVLIWLGVAYINAPYIELWEIQGWHYKVPLYVMPFACILIMGGMTSKNPFSLGAGNKGYDPVRPGFVGLTRHPVIWGLVLWSMAHIFPNGDAAAVLMFGFFLILCLIGIKTIEQRRRTSMREEQWTALSQGTGIVPISSLSNIKWMDILGWRLWAGLIFYGILLYLHEIVIGVAPIL